MKQVGYDGPLFVQALDHRNSFTQPFFGFQGAPTISPDEEQYVAVAAAKTLIYRGLLRAIEMGVPREELGILVDGQYGAHIAADARSRGITVALCVEKSGRRVFDFEYGVRWQDHLRLFDPDMVKVLVRYHPEDEAVARQEQLTRLRMLSDYVHGSNRHYLMVELLVPPRSEAGEEAGERYDIEVRPLHVVEAIRQIQAGGVEPDLWKVEGLEERGAAEAVSKQARSGEARARVGVVVLGRGSDAAKVHHWLEVAAPVDGFVGFAVGRTNFSDALADYLKGALDARAAIEGIAASYARCIEVWRAAAR